MEPLTRTRGFLVSLVAHTIAFGLLTMPSRPPAKAPGANRGAQAAQRRAPADASTKVVPPDRQAKPRPEAPKPTVPIRSTVLSIPGFNFDFAKIAGRSAVLFPFLDLQLSIPAGPLARFREFGSRSGRGLVFVHPVAAQPGDGRPRLRLSDAAFRALVDGSWSRRERWSAFRSIRTLTGQYTGEEGALPGLLRTYVDANALQPFYDTTSRDPRLWSELGIAADHADFVEFILDYATRHPSTRATTELLFLLDTLTQASFDALTTLLDTDPHDLRWTLEVNVDGYNLIKAIRAYYVDRLGGLVTNRGALQSRYDAMRVQILRSIVRTTPEEYRANDARFLIGAIAWRGGDRAAALRAWQELQVRPADYYGASSSYVLDVLNEGRAGAALSPAAAAQITKILDNEHARWLTFSTARLKRFGYDVDSY